MIHAHLQSVHGNTIKPHGKEFQKMTNDLNIALSLNIPLKHNFINWFRCDGPCRHTARHFFGYIAAIDDKKVLDKNRDAVKNHALKCGGKFHKISEPDADTLARLRRLKKNHGALVESEREEELCAVSGDKFNCKSCKWNELLKDKNKSTKMIQYSTDENE